MATARARGGCRDGRRAAGHGLAADRRGSGVSRGRACHQPGRGCCGGARRARRLPGEARGIRRRGRGTPRATPPAALAPARAATVDVVVVGADAVTPRAVWNKCGTLGLALGARAARRPFLVVTPSDRLVPAALARRLRVPDAEPEDVLAAPPRGV